MVSKIGSSTPKNPSGLASDQTVHQKKLNSPINERIANERKDDYSTIGMMIDQVPQELSTMLLINANQTTL
jgi:hypothetical protein